MSASHSGCLKEAGRSMDMNPKQFFFSLKESHQVDVSASLPTAWSRQQPHSYLFRMQSASSICQLARAGLAGHLEGGSCSHSANAEEGRAASCCVPGSSLLPAWISPSLHTPGPGCWAPSIMPVITQVSKFLGS